MHSLLITTKCATSKSCYYLLCSKIGMIDDLTTIHFLATLKMALELYPLQAGYRWNNFTQTDVQTGTFVRSFTSPPEFFYITQIYLRQFMFMLEFFLLPSATFTYSPFSRIKNATKPIYYYN